MIRFKTLSIKNFLSYGEAPTTINLDTIGTTLVVGEDLDNTASGIGANGVGKSVWLNALIYALYGRPISNISLNNLVNNVNNKNMRVEVEFERGDKTITVRRARKEKGNGNYAKIFIRKLGTDLDESKHDKTPDSINNINDYIVDQLGIPYELFVRIVAFPATHTPFLDLPVRHASQANQSDIMEELFRLTQLSVKAEALKSEIKDTKQTLEIKLRYNEQLEKEHERHNKQVVSAEERVVDWEEDRKDDIATVKKQLAKYEKVPVKEQEKLYKQVGKIRESLLKEKETQKDIEKVITGMSAEYTVIKSKISSFKDEEIKMLKWKSEHTGRVLAATREVDELPNTTTLNKQKGFHDEITILTEKQKILNKKEDVLLDEIDDNELALKKAEKELVHLEDAKCPYCLQKFEDAKGKIQDCYDTIKKCQQIGIDNEKDLIKIKRKVKTFKNDTAELNDAIEYSLEELSNYENNSKIYIKNLKDMIREECPYGDINEQDDLLSGLEKEFSSIKKELEIEADNLGKIDDIVDELEEDLTKCEDMITISTLDELYEIKNKITQHKTKIKDLKSEVNPHIKPLKELESLKLDPIDMDVINELDNLITHQNYLVKLLTKKDSFIRKNLLNKNLNFLNQRLHGYLAALGLPHKVEFTQEMTANITQFGRALDFGNLSSGQKARVNLGLSFSFRDVLQKSHDTINVCMLDEVLDVGLDSVGVQNAARMLKRKARDEDLALYIISHRDEVSNIFDHRMVVQMEKGFSSIKVE